LYNISSGVATITLNLPERKNSLGPELVNGLSHDLDRAIDDDDVRAILLTNTGNTFCAGADLKATRPGAGGDQPAESRTFIDVLNQIIESPKPVIGRVAGHCMGGGVGLAAVLDISIAPTDAKFGFTEVRLGVTPAVISVVVLPKLRHADAQELFLTGERISAERAAEVGLINHAVAPDELDAEVDRIVGMVVRGGPKALAGAKRLIAEVPGQPRDAAFAWTSEFSQSLFRSDEAAEGISAFNQRRDAAWVPQS
jgi:methylglutaconyl-CoA hydratase